ncbi:TetR/AcrR family transcriptional regulator [bacterium]|nr:TetR/AcrR family transcriptional regulator [bacterium]
MGIKERKERQKEQLRKEIIQAAISMLLKDGYEKLSMRRLAERIEYSPTTIYHYFRDKADLVFNVIEFAFSIFVERFAKINLLEDKDPREMLRIGLRTYIETALEYPKVYKVMLLIDYNMKTEVCQGLQKGTMSEKAFAFLHNSIRECVKENDFSEEEIAMNSQTIWAAIHGLSSLLITQPCFPWAPKDKLIDHTIDTLMKALEKRR